MATLHFHRHRDVDMPGDSRNSGYASPTHHTASRDDALRGMTSNGPTHSPPRAVVAHRSREEGDRERETRQLEQHQQHQHQQQQHQQHHETQQSGGRHESREGRDDRDARGGRDSRGERDSSNRKSRKSGSGGGSGGQGRRRQSRERSRSRDRYDRDGRPSSRRDRDRDRDQDADRPAGKGPDAAGGDLDRGRAAGPLSVSGKRPRSPSASFGNASGGGNNGGPAGGNGSGSQAKRSRRDRSPHRQGSQSHNSGRTRSRSPISHYPHQQLQQQHQQRSASHRYSSRSPPPQSASSSRRERRSKNKNKARNQGGNGPRRESIQNVSVDNRRDRSPDESASRRGKTPEGGECAAAARDNSPSHDDTRNRKPSPASARSRSPRDRERERDRNRDRDREKDRTRNHEHERERGRESGRERERDGNRGRERDRERDRDLGRDRYRDRNLGREREREREGDRGRHDRSPRSSKKQNRRRNRSRESNASNDGAPNSPNSPIDDDMATRGGSYRGGGGHGPYGKNQNQLQQHHHQSPHQHDPRRYLQQPQLPHAHPQSGNATPNSSFHGSQASQSPYSSSQGWGANQQQFSPQGQYPQQQPPHNNYSPNGTPPGPTAYRQANSPPYGAPSGPSAQYGSQVRSSSRGNHYGPGRCDHRNSMGNGGNGSYNGQWGAGQGAEGGYRHASPMAVSPHSGNSHQRHQNTQHGSHHPPHPDGDDIPMQDSEGAPYDQRQPPDDSSSGRGDRGQRDARHSAADDQMPPPSRQPPTGPQSKFSFAFKGATKPAVTAPKAEIAQKLSAAPRPQQQQQQQPSSQSPQHHGHHRPQQNPPTQPSRPQGPRADLARKDFPHGAPTEPASARARAANNGQQQSRAGPRYRKVKKIIRHPKARPTLPADLAASDSVYYRKPGNESVVGAGTYGKVFKAVHVYTKRLVALKRIRMEGEREGLPVTAIREIKLLQSLKHVNVVDLLEVMVEKNDCFMVFEYLSHDLNGLLSHPTFKMDGAQKKHMALQLFQGLDYLHRRGVLHRDIKAANILVSSDGILKLADFGLARFFAKHHQLDYSNRVITIWYRSPELLLGETRYGPAVDIWSAACVLMEIFTHKPIFPAKGGEISQIQKIYSVLGTPTKHEWPGLTDMPWFELMRPTYRQPNVFAEKYRDRVTPAAFDILRAMFHYNPAKRPSAAQVLAHPYFTQELPAARQAVELAEIHGEWHEFESKALRRAKKADEQEADAQRKVSIPVAIAEHVPGHDKKRPAEADPGGPGTGGSGQREAKRQQTEVTLPIVNAEATSRIVTAISDATATSIAMPFTAALPNPEPETDRAAEPAVISPPPEPELDEPVPLKSPFQQ